MISTKRVVTASFAFVFSFLTLIAPAFAAGANQGSVADGYAMPSTEIHFTSVRSSAVYPFQVHKYNHAFVGTVNGNSYYVWNNFSSAPADTVFFVGFADNTSGNGLCVASYNSTFGYFGPTDDSSGIFSLSETDASTGLHYRMQFNASPFVVDSSVPHFSTVRAFLDACVNGITSNPEASLVEDQDTFAFSADYTVSNTTGVDIAVATYNLGGNDIIVIGCYETVVVPGTIGGLPANYNVNQFLPREEHIPIRYCALISDTSFSSLTPFESLEDAVSACYDVLQESPNHGGGYTPADVLFTLQPGNVAYIEMADLTVPVILSSSKSSYSALFQTAGSYWPGNQLYKSGMTYPTVGTVLPGATPNQIPWQKNEWGKENLLGQTKQAYAEITASSNLLMIYNPYYQGDDSSYMTNTNLINSPIVITSKGIARNGIRVYNLQDSFSTVDGNYYYGIGSTNPNGYGDYFQSQNDPSATNPDITGWTDENGDPTTAPGVTPYNDPPENDSLADVITGFLSNIGSLFTQGHDAIKNLVESSSEFTSRLSSLFAWLPPPVYSVLISAIILAIIVGVLKVFL